jgi:hypothetical protein
LNLGLKSSDIFPQKVEHPHLSDPDPNPKSLC